MDGGGGGVQGVCCMRYGAAGCMLYLGSSITAAWKDDGKEEKVREHVKILEKCHSLPTEFHCAMSWLLVVLRSYMT